MENKKKVNSIVLTVIAIATLLVAVIGATYAYFTASVTGNTTASSVIVKTASNLTLTFKDTDTINLANAYPGASDSKTFTIKNNSATQLKYTIQWAAGVTNSFAVKSDLVYSISCSNSGATKAQTTAPSTSSSAQNIVAGTIGAGVTQTCTLTLHFRETASNQNSNQGKSFSGKLQLSADSTGNSVYYTDSARSGTTTRPTAY